LPAPAVEVLDVTGAGDAFSAGVCASLYQDPQDLALACRRGLALSALTLQTEATVHPDLGPELLSNIL
jgi:pseudouridine kinase